MRTTLKGRTTEMFRVKVFMDNQYKSKTKTEEKLNSLIKRKGVKMNREFKTSRVQKY